MSTIPILNMAVCILQMKGKNSISKKVEQMKNN